MFQPLLLVFLACVLSVAAFAPTSRRVISKTQINDIPKFNWPGSMMPASIMEKLFSGNKDKAAAAPAKAVAPKKGAAPAKAAAPKDMRWGGRPNPTPEMYVEEPKPKAGAKKR